MAKVRFLATMLLAATWLLTLGAGSVQAQQMVRSRVTVSSQVVRYQGWEKGLIRRDPTLRHWAWIPVDSYRYRTAAYQSSVTPSAPRKSVYSKPIHVATVLPTQRKKKPYVHVENRSTLTNADVSAKLSTNNVSAGLSNNSVAGQVALAPQTSTYGDAYGTLSHVQSKRGDYPSGSKSVYGRVKGF